jgi:uncharacterized membrane protein
MFTVETTLVIGRPVEELFTFLMTPENAPLWQSNVVECRWTSEGPVGVGTTELDVRRVLGQRMETQNVITEYEPDRKVSMKSMDGPVPIESTMIFESVTGGAKLNVAFRGDAKGFLKVVEPLLAHMIKRNVKADFGNLKGLLEARA